MIVPMLTNSAPTDIGSLIGQAAGGGLPGAILTAIVGAIKNRSAESN